MEDVVESGLQRAGLAVRRRRDEVEALEHLDRSLDRPGEKCRQLPGGTLPHQHRRHLMAALAQKPFHRNGLGQMTSSFSLDNEYISHSFT